MTTDDAQADPRMLAADRAPTPFTADEIRRACPVGRTLDLLAEPAGGPPRLRRSVFVECDDEGATLERRPIDDSGGPLLPAEVERTTWRELQAHASFEAARTNVAPETIETPLGRLDCLRYTVRGGEEAGSSSFWFARALPGMPVLFSNTERGAKSLTVTMLSSVVVDGDQLRFAETGLELLFACPRQPPSGAALRVRRESERGRSRIRVATEDGNEVYFELAGGTKRPVGQLADELRTDVSGRYMDAVFDNLAPAIIDGLPALAFEFRFADRVRRAYFVELEAATCRVILDPRSTVNLDILATLRRR